MKQKRAFYHLLYTLFPVLFLYAYNIEEVLLQVIYIPLVVSLLGALLIWGIWLLLMKNGHKAALLTFLCLFLFFSFGYFRNIIKGVLPVSNRLPPLIFPVSWGLLFGFLGYLAVRTRRDLGRFTTAANLAMTILILIPVAQIALFNLTPVRMTEPDNPIPDALSLSHNLEAPEPGFPDIYYLIFDRYANSKILEEYYDFDNREFLDAMKAQGFYIAGNSRCNYPRSYLSISSSLNMQYHNHLVKEGPIRKRAIYSLLKDHKVFRLLKSLGYKYYQFGSWWEATKYNENADFIYRGAESIDLNQDFIMQLMKTTLLGPFTAKTAMADIIRASVWATFAKLAEMPDEEGPKFVFLHILLPHSPFLFEADGSVLEPLVRKRRTIKKNYVNQLKFTNSRILELVAVLLEKSKKPPIIIIQSDEGPTKKEFSFGGMTNIKQPERAEIMTRIRCRILNMYYLPGVDRKDLYASISPVNSFRLIFNLYFGADFPLLEDNTYFGEADKKILKRFQLLNIK
ncbi:MAG: hypothetical protein JXB23_08965 [Candidatus Aminicenantes bacterium]|nr:hypothetical protein [Candidatus Aminicenantes bacterium]